MKLRIKTIAYIFCLYILFPKKAMAYLDPGTGSYVFQILIAGLLGGLFFFKSIVKKIKALYKQIMSKTGKKRSHENV
jgi:hypothetical protein